MKNFIFALFLLIPFICNAEVVTFMCGTPPAVAACTTSSDSELYTFEGSYDGTLAGAWEASKFTSTNAFTLTEYQIDICDAGADAGNVVISVYTHDAANDEPESEVAGTEVSVAMSAFPDCTTYTATNVALSTPKALSASTVYWVVTEEQNGAARSWERLANVGGRRSTSNDGITWDVETADKSGQVTIMGCE